MLAELLKISALAHMSSAVMPAMMVNTARPMGVEVPGAPITLEVLRE
jgi:hypothetical protein